jgi:hypothetical protein
MNETVSHYRVIWPGVDARPAVSETSRRGNCHPRSFAARVAGRACWVGRMHTFPHRSSLREIADPDNRACDSPRLIRMHHHFLRDLDQASI